MSVCMYIRVCKDVSGKEGALQRSYLCMNAFWIKSRGYKRTKLVKYFYGFINPVTDASCDLSFSESPPGGRYQLATK